MPTTAYAELVASLAHLPDDANLTVTIPVGDLRHALEAKAGGPRELTPADAAHYLGRSIEFWRDAAKRGAIEGAYQEKRGRIWRLPRGACEAHLRALQQRGRKSAPRSRDSLPFDGGRARGPRKAHQASPA